MHLCLFEDKFIGNFLPLVHFRPVYDLRSGMLTSRERIVRLLAPSILSLHVRPYLSEFLREENSFAEVNEISSDAAFMVNGRVILDSVLAKEIRRLNEDQILFCGDTVVAARLSGLNLQSVRQLMNGDSLDLFSLDGISRVEVDAKTVRYPWDLVYANEFQMAIDFAAMTRSTKQMQNTAVIHKSAVLLNKKNIYIGKGSFVSPGVVIDATNGPVYIGDAVKVYPQSTIEGPCFIGGGSQVKIGAKIYHETSIGPVCKIGGEIECSILQGYSNKQHDGFLGHSYLGMWVNLGAGTTTSDLKNTYGSVRVQINGESVDSGKTFIGLIAGDHVKTGINATLDTGTVIGSSSNIYGTSLPPKAIPSFSWGDASFLQTYNFEKALEVSRKVMSRRNVTSSPSYEKALQHIFLTSEHERSKIRT